MIKMRAGLAALTRLQQIMLRPRSMKYVNRVARRLLPIMQLPLSIWIPMDNPPMVRLKTLHIRLRPSPALSLPTEQARTLILHHHHKTLIPDQASPPCLLRMYIRRHIHTRAAPSATAMREGIMRPGIQGRAMKMIQNIHLLRQVWLILLQPLPRIPG